MQGELESEGNSVGEVPFPLFFIDKEIELWTLKKDIFDYLEHKQLLSLDPV